jgi:hypothetical protein
MPAKLILPKSTHPEWRRPCPGFTSLKDLQQEKWERYGRNHPPREFDPAWMLELTIVKNIEDGVELWKWSTTREAWELDAIIVWENENV